MPNDFIDLGCGLDSKPMGELPMPKKSYPSFCFTCDEEIALPDGEFTFTAKGRKIDVGANTRDPEDPRYRYEIEVQGFKPMGGVKGAVKDMGETFKDRLNKGMAAKMDDEEGE